MDDENRRARYRIPYPETERPRLVLGGSIVEVVECSEHGLHFLAPEDEVPAPGAAINGRLRFPRGEEVRVQGTVVRVQGPEVSVRLTGDGIPFGTILKEQLYLRRRDD